MTCANCEDARKALQISLGATACAAGLDKFFNLLTDWEQYVSPMAARRLPMSKKNFMRLVGVVEIAVGAAVLKGPTRLGAYVASGWLAAITANLIASGKYFDVAARDANMAMAAFVLGRLCESERGEARRREREDLLHAA
jgi:uncharacterized membrane protein YphA (DoxX/SURF4 family)